jgi:hypothetical protein
MLNAHLAALKLPTRSIRWFDNLGEGYRHIMSIIEAAGVGVASAEDYWKAAMEAAGIAALETGWDVATYAAWNAAWTEAAWDAPWDTARKAAWDAARKAAWGAARRKAAWKAAWETAREAPWDTPWEAAKDAAIDTAWDAACINVYNERPHEAGKHLVTITTLLREAFENGLGLYWITPEEIVCVPQPEIHIMNRALHCETGPAAHWPDESYWFWHGYQVPQWAVEEKHKLSPATIAAEDNAELRRVMLEIYGFGRWISETGATLISEDVNQGQPRKLYEATLAGGRIRIVHVVNGSLENDGSRREFFLGAPDDVKTPHEAVAALYGFNPEAYSEYART